LKKLAMLFLALNTFLGLVAAEPVLLDLPPRYMWGNGEGDQTGYCGSMAIQTMGIYYGNWFSQDKVRGTSGGTDGRHEILLGPTPDDPTSARHACTTLGLNITHWPFRTKRQPQVEAFLDWARDGLKLGQPLFVGVYVHGLGGDSQSYDHIIPMRGFDGDEAVYVNNLMQNTTKRWTLDSRYVTNRRGCDRLGQPGSGFCLPSVVSYGIKVHGNNDPNSELLPVRLVMSQDWEPDYSKEDREKCYTCVKGPPAMLSATLKIWGLTPGQKYTLLRFDSPDALPKQGGFQAARGRAALAHDWTAEAAETSWPVQFMSDTTQFYRVVRSA